MPLPDADKSASGTEESVGDRAWVEVEWTVLPPAERAVGLPEDTRNTPYMARTRGLADSRAVPGAAATVVTVTGRRQTGIVVAVNPGYTHSFGAPIPAWIEMREGIRHLVHAGGVPGARSPDAEEG